MKNKKLDLKNVYAKDDWCAMCMACTSVPGTVYIGMAFFLTQSE